MSYFENSGEKEVNRPAVPKSFESCIVEALGFVKTQWNLDRESAVQLTSNNSCFKRDVAMEDAYADYC